MQERKITIRPIEDKAEMQMIMAWAEAEKWNPGKYDYEPYFAMNKENYLLLLVDEKPVGSISLVRYSEEFAFIGFFIVLPEYRRQGLGVQLWEEALKRLEKCQTVGLYSVPPQVSRYEASGFKGSHMIERQIGNAPERLEELSSRIKISQNPHSVFKTLCAYDRDNFKYNRQKLLRRMLAMPQTWALISFDKNGKVNGYGLIRPCVEGFRIGPLYANNFNSAKLLFGALLSKIPAESFILDMPRNNRFSQIFAAYFRLQHVPEADTMIMFKGEEPEGVNKYCYGVCSLEVG
jgi:GNAT superfamily N-acetyltransferase